MNTSRRNFLRQSSALALGMGILPTSEILAARQGVYIPPSDKIRFGVIGCKGMGWANMRTHLSIPQVDCVAMCDVDDSVLKERSKGYGDLRDNKIDTYKDYRKLLEDKNIDAIVIGTPDHWHCKMFCRCHRIW